jgi:hypothetical protein
MVVVILLLHCASQKLVKKSLTPGSILVGHSLNHALAILKIDHKQVTDTGLLFHNSGSHTGPLPTIVNLCKVSQLYSLQITCGVLSLHPKGISLKVYPF